MADNFQIKYRNNFLYWGLLIYLLCLFAFPSSPVPGGGLESLQIPSFALLLLILIQVLFPQFRFSKSANLIAVLAIVGSPILQKSISS